MVHTSVKVSKPMLRENFTGSFDVSGIIGLAGDATGSVVLSFPSAVACKAASAFAGTEIAEGHPDFADAIGELANMVAGNAKASLEGLRVSISLPSVVSGKQHTVVALHDVQRIVIPCETPFGPFYVDVGMRVESAASKNSLVAGAAS